MSASLQESLNCASVTLASTDGSFTVSFFIPISSRIEKLNFYRSYMQKYIPYFTLFEKVGCRRVGGRSEESGRGGLALYHGGLGTGEGLCLCN